jgi:hypothetical protein
MPSFDAGGGDTTPFGRNEYLRSTRGMLHESYTCAKSAVPARTIDGNAGQKVLQPGTVMARITAAGADQGKIGPYQVDATDGRQTAANIVGIEHTFLPWTLMERDVEVSVVYGAVVHQAWCIQYTDAATPVAVSDATVTAIKALPYFDNLIFEK